MAVDLTKTTYTYTVNSDGTVDFKADADDVQQRLASVDLSTADNLKAYLDDYCTAYIAGLAVEQVQIGTGITTGQSQSGTAPAPDAGSQGA